MEALLHVSEAHAGRLLVAADAFQQLLALLLGDAGALLPLLDPLGQDLIDTTAQRGRKGRQVGRQTQTGRQTNRKTGRKAGRMVGRHTSKQANSN